MIIKQQISLYLILLSVLCTKCAFIQQLHLMSHVIYAAILNIIGILLFASGFFLTRVELPDIATCSSSDTVQDSIQLNDNEKCCYPWKQQESHLMPHTSPGMHTNNAKEKNGKSKCSSYDRIVILIIDALRYDFMDLDNKIINKEDRSYQSGSSGISIEDNDSDDIHTLVYHNKLKFVAKTLKEKANKSFLRKFLADPPTTTMQRLKGVFTGGLPTFIDIKDDVASSAITEDNLLQQLINKKMDMVFMGDDTWVSLFPNAFKRSFPYPSFNVKDLHTVDLGVIDHLFPELRNKDWDVLVGHFLGVDHVGHRYGPDHIEMGLKLTQMDHVIEDVINEIEKRSQKESERILLLVFGDHGMTGDGNHGGATDLERGAALFAYSTYPIFDPSIDGKNGKDNIVHLFINESQGGNIQQIDLAPTLSVLMDIPIPFGNLGSVIPELMFGTLSNDVDEEKRLEKVNKALKTNIDQVIAYFEEYSSKAKGSLNMDKVKSLKQMANDIFTNVTLSKRDVFLSSRSILHILADDARALWTQFDTTMMILGIILLFVSCLVLSYPYFLLIRKVILQDGGSGDRIHLSSYVGLIVVLLSYAALFSNSYIVAESHVFSFLCCTFALSLGIECISSLRSKENKNKDDIHTESQYSLSSSAPRILLVTLLVMLCSRLSLETGDEIRTAAHEAASMEFNQICFQMICWLCICLFCFRFFDSSMISLLFLSLPVTHWLLQYINHPMFLVPRISFIASILSVGVHLIRPAQISKSSVFISHISSYSLLLGPASPAAILLALCQCYGFYYLVQHLDDRSGTDITSSLSSENIKFSFLSATYLYLSSCLFFFSSGHKCDFGTLHITSAYVGFEEFAYYRGAVMLTLNTFGNYLFPILAYLLRLVSHEDGDATVSALAWLFSIRTTATATFVHFQRRHLMVWAIFAPKLVYDASSLLFLDFVMLMYYIVKRLVLHTKEKHHIS